MAAEEDFRRGRSIAGPAPGSPPRPGLIEAIAGGKGLAGEHGNLHRGEIARIDKAGEGVEHLALRQRGMFVDGEDVVAVAAFAGTRVVSPAA